MRITLRSLLYQLHRFFEWRYTREYNISDDSGEFWVAIGGDASSVPRDTAASHYENWPVIHTGVTPPALSGPAWMGEGKDYLAFGVDMSAIQTRDGPAIELWLYSSLNQEDDYLDPKHPDKIWPDVARKVRRDLLRANEVLSFLDGRGGLPQGLVDRSYDASNLEALTGRSAVKEELRKARQVMDERCAAINYAMSRTTPATRSYLKRRYAAYFSAWHILDAMRGAYLDYRHLGPGGTPVLDLLHKGVPVYFTLEPGYVPRVPLEEAHLAEGISSCEEFSNLFEDASPWIDDHVSLPSPRKSFGFTSTERAANPQSTVPRLQRLDDMTSYGRSLLGDLLHDNLPPIVGSLNVPDVGVTGSALLEVEPLSEVRMMYWASKNRVSSSADILGEALSRGWSFRVLYSDPYLDELKARLPASSVAAEACLETVVPVSETEHLYILDEWNRYLDRLALLLARPNAKAFLWLGGIYWRLALLFGEPYVDSWKVDIVGPSDHLIAQRGGYQVVHGHRCDTVTHQEMDMLLGLTVSKVDGSAHYWFPPMSLLVKHRYHDGEWSPTEECLIMERYESLQRGNAEFRPLTEAEWEHELDVYPRSRLQRDSFVTPGIQKVQALLADMRRELGGSWNLAPLSHVDRAIDLEAPDGWA